ncbi:MaoC family dehydratase [Capillimicrobium parvum]|uniref:Mesaconyl-CoA hydratase n=1 Tax=Capillimicrobium parvum TaxID=2884022 RepID=A0A9E6Y3D5_9ACTN|nr:MaoC family dehydratase [Capillimicrobium parvum]UGS39140.1 Mesaconyl-CoA hydratase [Capillimicrobium parvum]
MAVDHPPAPKAWRGRFYEDFDIGDVYPSRLGRTITETDNIWFTCLTLNTNQVHFNDEYAKGTPFGKPLVNSTLTLSVVTGLTVPDTSENATANLSWTDINLPNPVYVGDTLWAETEITAKRESKSRPNVGIVSVRTRGINQRREVVIEFRRTFMTYKRDAPEVTDLFPGTDSDWTV